MLSNLTLREIHFVILGLETGYKSHYLRENIDVYFLTLGINSQLLELVSVAEMTYYFRENYAEKLHILDRELFFSLMTKIGILKQDEYQYRLENETENPTPSDLSNLLFNTYNPFNIDRKSDEYRFAKITGYNAANYGCIKVQNLVQKSLTYVAGYKEGYSRRIKSKLTANKVIYEIEKSEAKLTKIPGEVHDFSQVHLPKTGLPVYDSPKKNSCEQPSKFRFYADNALLETCFWSSIEEGQSYLQQPTCAPKQVEADRNLANKPFKPTNRLYW